MTIFERIKQMKIDELAEWFDSYSTYENTLWDKWWDENYCKKCEPEKCYVEYLGKVAECAWCEVHDKCKYFQYIDGIPDTKQIVKMWLESEYGN